MTSCIDTTVFEKTTRDLMDFIAQSPSCYHVIENIRHMLRSEGFWELSEHTPWHLSPGSRCFVVRGDSSVIAFQVPASFVPGFQIIASHSDSPSFKIKEKEELFVDGHYVELNAERYGGMLCAPWFDRPLSIAGRAMVKDGLSCRTRLVNFDRDLVMIPNVAIHMNRGVNEGYTYHAQKDMIPLLGDENARGAFERLLAEQLNTDSENILSADLFLYNRVPGTIWGANREFFSSTKLDDLQCAYASMKAFTQAQNPDHITVCCIFDHEEVGSSSRQGADSTFLSDTLERITECLGQSREEYRMALADSFMVSADNAHAVHPHHLDKADPTNRPYMNGGPVIKYSANQKYTTDALSAALFSMICEKAGVPFQTFANHSDQPGGSTLGNISASHVSIPTVDIGAPQLAMHSPYETGGVKDTAYLMKAMTEFFQTPVHRDADGGYHLG